MDGQLNSSDSRVGFYIKFILILGAWAILTAALNLALVLTWNPVVMARGSDMLIKVYRVPNVPAYFAFAFFSLTTFSIALSYHKVVGKALRQFKPWLGTAGLASISLLLLSLHAIAIDSKHEASEFIEFIGPFKIREFSAPDYESQIPAFCEKNWLKVKSPHQNEVAIFLGIGFWKIPSEVCQDHRLLYNRLGG